MNPEIILGPPGTGKTEALMRIIEEELKGGVAPEHIGLVSFTRRAAREAVDRALGKFALTRSRLPHFSTLHSLCYRGLGLISGDVLEGRALREFAEWIGIRITTSKAAWEEGGTWGQEPGDRILHMENLARVSLRTLQQQYDLNADELPWHEVQRVAQGLQVYKAKRSLTDYTDMLSQWLAAGLVPKLEVLLIDELQDLSMLQWKVVERLAEGARRVVVAGDDDQAIYRWAGAALEHFIELQGTVRVLDRSWRVPSAPQKVALEVVSRIQNRRPKIWAPRAEAGIVDRWGRFEDLDVDGPQVLILARNRYVLAEQVEPSLRHQGIIYEIGGKSSVDTDLLAAIRGWEDLRAGKQVSVEIARRIYEFMSTGRGVERGYKSLPGRPDDQLVNITDLQKSGGLLTSAIWHEALDRIAPEEMSYLLAARRRGEALTRTPRVRLSTIHGAKGAEAEHVVVLLEQAKRTSEEALNQPEDEARVWYVAATRARQRLSIVSSQGKYGYDL